jgi:UDP-N-acetylmuramyl pentapeptide phosphotransferase/UDP-N-acetylglucosamine-1-phosphate transferase
MEILLQNGLIMGGFFLLSYVIAYLTIPVIIKVAKEKKFVDYPDNDRKLHTRAIPTLGGVAIFLDFLLSITVSPWADEIQGFSYLVGALLISFHVGLKDDMYMLSPRTKLFSQIAAAGLVVFGSGITVSHFYGVLGLAEIPYWIAVPFSLFTIIVVINAMNLIDGIDGLAGGIGVLASALFGVSFLYVGQVPMAMFSFCLTGALLGFLYYNFSPASIFMGDTGSTIVGFLLSIQAVQFIKLGAHPDFSSVFSNAAPVLAVAILVLPLFDTIRVVIKRLRRNKSIFEPGQEHVHHELLRMGFFHKNASLLLYGKSLFLITMMGILSTLSVNVNLLLGILVFASMLVYPTNGFKRRILARIFGYDWQHSQRQQWGIEFDHDKMTSLNGNGRKSELNLESGSKQKDSDYKEEMDSIAV